jgi:hypothetical protein
MQCITFSAHKRYTWALVEDTDGQALHYPGPGLGPAMTAEIAVARECEPENNPGNWSTTSLWACLDSNQGPPAYQASALTD